MSNTSGRDHALRTMGTEGNFRIIIASTADTAREVLAAQNPADHSRGLLADVITASLLLRLTMSPDYRLQTILQDQSAGRLVGDSHPDGTTRGLVQQFGAEPVSVGDTTQLSVHRTMFGGDTHQGVVRTSDGQTLADAVTGYLHRSEQITSVVRLGHRFDGDELAFAGGYIVQHVPGDDSADQSALALMTARLENLPAVPRLFDNCDGDTADVADMLYGPLEFEKLATNDFHPGCICSPERVMRALGTLSEDDRAELAASDEHLEVDCDYCATTHRIDPAEL